MFYHSEPSHSFYMGNDKKVYDNHLDLFKAVTMPEALRSKEPGVEAWVKMRLYQLTGHPRKAARYKDIWMKANEI